MIKKETFKDIYNWTAFMVQSVMVISVLLGAIFLSFKLYTWITVSGTMALTGKELSFMAVLGSWYLLGIIGAMVWPIKYRENMAKKDWVGVVKVLPIWGVAGPWSLILGFPI